MFIFSVPTFIQLAPVRLKLDKQINCTKYIRKLLTSICVKRSCKKDFVYTVNEPVTSLL